MYNVSNSYKKNVKQYGRQFDYILSYNDEVISKNNIYSIVKSFKTDILSTVMIKLRVETKINVPINSELNFSVGVLNPETGQYEYLDYGKFQVFSNEYNASTYSYELVCYDEMLKMMVPFDLNVVYPITVQNLLIKICEKFDLTFSSQNIINGNTTIKQDIFSGINYTYRDVLEEIAIVTCSTIQIKNGELILKKPYQTNEIVEASNIKNTNSFFQESYGPINSLVFSRVSDSDSIFRKNNTSINQNGLCELKIKDKQILSTNDRADFIDEMFQYLNNIHYNIFNVETTGLTFLEPCDIVGFDILSDEITDCLVLENEVAFNSGLMEGISNNKPEMDESNYKTMSNDDRAINETYRMADKQNQTIQDVITNVSEQNQKISEVLQTVGEINSKIGDIADITTSGENTHGIVELNNINISEPIRVEVRPLGESIAYLYPSKDLYPSNDLLLKDRKVIFENKSTNEVIDYELPDDLWYISSEYYDEFILDYDLQKCLINKKVKLNEDGTLSPLIIPQTIEYDFPHINLTDGDYKICLPSYDDGYLFVRLMAQNIYTTQFATRAELHSSITQKANEINLKVDEKLDSKDFTGASIKLAINNDTSSIKLKANSIDLEGYTTINKGFSIDENGNAIMNNATINGGEIKLFAPNGTLPKIMIVQEGNNYGTKLLAGGTYYYNKQEGISIQSNYISYNKEGYVKMWLSNTELSMQSANDSFKQFKVNLEDSDPSIYLSKSSSEGTSIYADRIECASYDNISLASKKKNFKLLSNALDIVMKSDIYSYNWKTENDNESKHFGLIIGTKYKTPKEFLSKSKNSIDMYSTLSIALQSIKELNERINKIERNIENGR